MKDKLTRFFFSASYRLMLNYRMGRWCYLKKTKLATLVGLYLKYVQNTKRNCFISYASNIDKSVKFMHPVGVVVGDNVIVGRNVKIWQQVTLGSHGKKGLNKKYPIVEEGVRIYAGAKIIGGITIGRNAIIGANAVVIKDVPAGTVAVGIPAKILKHESS